MSRVILLTVASPLSTSRAIVERIGKGREIRGMMWGSRSTAGAAGGGCDVVWQDGVVDELVRGSDGSAKGSRSLIHDAQAAAPKVVPAATVGRLLRSARERQGLGLDEVEATLLI